MTWSRALPVTRSYDSLLTAVPVGHRRQPRRHVVADDADLHEPRRTRQRGQHGARRLERRRGVQRRRRLRLHPRHRERRGSADEPLRRSWRSGEGRHLPERRPEDRAATRSRGTLRERRGLVVAGQQSRRHAASRSAFRIRRRFTTTTTPADRSAARSRKTSCGSTRRSGSSDRRRTFLARTRTRMPATRMRGRTSRTRRSPTATPAARTSTTAASRGRRRQRNKFSFYEDYQGNCSQASYLPSSGACRDAGFELAGDRIVRRLSVA